MSSTLSMSEKQRSMLKASCALSELIYGVELLVPAVGDGYETQEQEKLSSSPV